MTNLVIGGDIGGHGSDNGNNGNGGNGGNSADGGDENFEKSLEHQKFVGRKEKTVIGKNNMKIGVITQSQI